jgi:hypothetical protein
MKTVAKRVKPSWAGNSGIPPPPFEEVELVVDVAVGFVLVAEVDLVDVDVEVLGVVMDVVELVEEDEVEVDDEGLITETEFEL